MKKTVWLLPLLAALIIPAHANYDFYKKNTVKLMYKDAAIASARNFKADDLDTLYAYSDRELQNAIAITKADAMNPYQEAGNDMSSCNEVREILNLSTSNSLKIDEIAGISYTLLNNGKVRVSMMLTDDYDINSSNFTDFRDFSLICDGENCKITDVYDSEGKSGKLAADNACR